ncbi:MAG TPA: glycine zipper family protein [Myxococcota bacterium]|nr:glycine zipper family protein [Myxococcota bacterium]
MTSPVSRTALVLALFALASSSVAQNLIVYPAKKQTPAQQNKDQAECQIWAKNNTGIDPLALANAASQPAPVAAQAAPPPPSGQRVRGAARGAAGGAAVGAIAGDAGKGAAIGAVAGTMVGGARHRAAAEQTAAANQQAQAQASQQAQANQAGVQSQLATFNKAYAACLEGRGYTVK